MVSDFHKKNFKLAVYSDESGLYCYAQFDTISTLTQESCIEIFSLRNPGTYFINQIQTYKYVIVAIILHLKKSRRRQNKIVRTSWETKCQQIDQTRISAWTNWSECDITCNQNNEFVTGKRERTRYCIKVCACRLTGFFLGQTFHFDVNFLLFRELTV